MELPGFSFDDTLMFRACFFFRRLRREQGANISTRATLESCPRRDISRIAPCSKRKKEQKRGISVIYSIVAMPAPRLETERLILREWREGDMIPFAEMNRDERVMEFFPSVLSREESDALARAIQRELQEKEYGLWAVEVKDGPPFIGFVGLHYQDFEATFTPCIEIGWRIAFPYWGKGYAYEAASRVMQYAKNELKLKEVVSFTAKINERSRRLMEKLGMEYQEDFMNAKLPAGHPLRPHILYRS